MRHIRKLTLLLIAALVLGCFSAQAWAVFRQPRGLKEIGDSAFEGVPMPANYDLLYGIEKIGSRAFVGTGVKMFWLPETLQSIAPDAFDKGTAFTCSPGTYAEKWCLENGMDFDYIKPYLDVDSTNLLYGQTATLTADYIYSKEPTEYFWEMRERERYWTPIPDENGPVLGLCALSRLRHCRRLGFHPQRRCDHPTLQRQAQLLAGQLQGRQRRHHLP